MSSGRPRKPQVNYCELVNCYDNGDHSSDPLHKESTVSTLHALPSYHIMNAASRSDGGWRCNDCLYLNNNSEEYCEMCTEDTEESDALPSYHIMNAASRSDKGWKCNNCLYLNDNSDEYCAKCSLHNITFGTTVEVCWPDDDKYYPGVVTNHVLTEGRPHMYRIVYDDGEVETLDMTKENFHIIDI